MQRLALVVVVVIACGCRRKHEVPTYASDTRPATARAASPSAAPTQDAAPSGSAENPLGEPVLSPRDTRTSMPDGGTLNGDPRGPRAATWQAIVDAAMPALQACFDRAELPPGEIAVTVHYTVELPGYTGAVTASGKAPKPVLDCCVKV
ncbi:MAG TPA: hypothetical protein VHB97_22210, partial [Polyangia bacterium]|nr:hypothetical protein [Polyangia bacterium]